MKRFALPLSALAFCALSGAVSAQTPNCDAPADQAEAMACAEQAYAENDAALNKTYKAAMAKMEEVDSFLSPEMQGAAKSLKNAQRAWIAYRDAACETEGYKFAGGTLETLVVASCLAYLTEERTKHLSDLLQD